MVHLFHLSLTILFRYLSHSGSVVGGWYPRRHLLSVIIYSVGCNNIRDYNPLWYNFSKTELHSELLPARTVRVCAPVWLVKTRTRPLGTGRFCCEFWWPNILWILFSLRFWLLLFYCIHRKHTLVFYRKIQSINEFILYYYRFPCWFLY